MNLFLIFFTLAHSPIPLFNSPILTMKMYRMCLFLDQTLNSTIMHDFEHICGKHKSDNKYIVGFIFIIIGAILLGRNFHFIPHWISNVFISWQMLLIVIGIVAIFIKKNLVSGLILISIGGIFLLNKFWFFTPFQWQMIWPAAFILIGILLVSNVIGSHYRPNKYNKHRSINLDEFEDDDFEMTDVNYKKE